MTWTTRVFARPFPISKHQSDAFSQAYSSRQRTYPRSRGGRILPRLGGHQNAANPVLCFLWKRSGLCCRPGVPVLRGSDLGIHVVLSQTLVALLLIAAVVVIYVLVIRSG
jgi:hypothetical protein